MASLALTDSSQLTAMKRPVGAIEFIEGLHVWGNDSSLNVRYIPKLLDTDQSNEFPCPKCGKVYRWMTSLSRHMRLECGQERKYHCQVCGRRFKHKHHLMDHIEVHERNSNM
uniref:C2H2-type domain-containing protein n=1 Tax=Timema shepardi TaxID=629360 RepID=A0A7R9FWT3_TIMSH|nr:unnamed protein product [Timema shepardi]